MTLISSCGSKTLVDPIFIVVMENTSFDQAMTRPEYQKLAQKGILYTNYHGVTHPSQPNYLAMTAGDTFGADNSDQNLNAQHIGDLIENAGLQWRVYAEDFPGNCSLISVSGNYARRHVPFLSYTNVTQNPSRCARILKASSMETDIAANGLAHLSYFIPNNINNGHDSGYATGAQRLAEFVAHLENTLATYPRYTLVVTFDEGDVVNPDDNRVFSVITGPGIAVRTVDFRFSHYDLLYTIEKKMGMSNLGRNDANGRDMLFWN